jgi:hypothetical protein
MFDTYGPYTLISHDKTGIDTLWDEFRADPYEPNIENAVGVYLVCVEQPDGSLVPWYVGQTYVSFGARIKRHFDKGRFKELLDKGPLKIILIGKAKSKKYLRARLDRKVIDWLEIDLIDECVKVNGDLLNRKYVRFLAEIWVGGYRGDGALDPAELEKYPAYRALAKMLNLVRGR